MADVLGKKISELAETTDLAGLYTIGSDRNNQSKKVPLHFVKEAADYANAQGDYAKGVGDTVQGNTGVDEYPVFSASTQYAAGSVVRYNDKLYRFTSLHPAGSWVGTDAVETSIKAETELKLTELESEVGVENYQHGFSSKQTTIKLDYQIKKGQSIELTLTSDNSTTTKVGFFFRGTADSKEVLIAEIGGKARYTAEEDKSAIYVYNYSDAAELTFNVRFLGLTDDVAKLQEDTNPLVDKINAYSTSTSRTLSTQKVVKGQQIIARLTNDSSSQTNIIFSVKKEDGSFADETPLFTFVGEEKLITIATDGIATFYNNGDSAAFSVEVIEPGVATLNKFGVQNLDNDVAKVKEALSLDVVSILQNRMATTNLFNDVKAGEDYVITIKDNSNSAEFSVITSDANSNEVETFRQIFEVGKQYIFHISKDAATLQVYKHGTFAAYSVEASRRGIKQDTICLMPLEDGAIYAYSSSVRDITTLLVKKGDVIEASVVNAATATLDVGPYILFDGKTYDFPRITYLRNKVKLEVPIDGVLHFYWYGTTYYPYSVNIQKKGKVNVLNDKVDSFIHHSFDVANGDMSESSIVNDSLSAFVKDGESAIKKRICGVPKAIVAMDHDDINFVDYMGVRKLYNKYGFNATFNFILKPFANIAEKIQRIENMTKMLQDGNEFSLHAIFQKSFWSKNPLFDITPNGNSLFAPQLSELKGNNADGTGTNQMNDAITATTLFSQIKFYNVPDKYNAIKVASATHDDWVKIISSYCVYHRTSNIDTIEGLDLNDNIVSKGILEWLEYWYNELVDNTLGYSSNSDVISERYNEDYEIPNGASIASYYPDAAHFLSGKVVFFDDVKNANYNNAEYQKVGRFKKGLFKGCASSCNFEAFDRIIKVASAFCRHYFGMTTFLSHGMHGEGYYAGIYRDSNNIGYYDRNKSVVSNDLAQLYQSRLKKKVSLIDILKFNGVKTQLSHSFPTYTEPLCEGEIGLIYGKDRMIHAIDGEASKGRGTKGYFNVLGGTSVGSSDRTMSYDVWNRYASEQDNLLKWAYENAGQMVTASDGSSRYMLSYIKNIIDNIRACMETGKVASFEFDSNTNSPNVIAAVELFLQFCYVNDIEVVPFEKARRLCGVMNRATNNYFPNPSFEQMLIDTFGESSHADAYIPNGWWKSYGKGEFSVERTDIDNQTYSVFNMRGVDDVCKLESKIYGLPCGKYKFSCVLKSSNTNRDALTIYKKYNRELIINAPSVVVKSFEPNSEYSIVEAEFVVEASYKGKIQNNAISESCGGYEDDVAFVMIELVAEANKDVTIYNPTLKVI